MVMALTAFIRGAVVDCLRAVFTRFVLGFGSGGLVVLSFLLCN